MIVKAFTTSAGYTSANQIGPDPSGVSLVVLTDRPVVCEVFYGAQGQSQSIGEITLQQSTNFAGATGARLKNDTAAGAAAVTVYLFQTKDPLPTFLPVGATQVSTLPDVVLSGQVTTTAGTQVALAASTAILGVGVKALPTNTGNVYVGDSTVSSSSGLILQANDSASFDIDDLALVFFDVDNTGEGVSWLAVAL